MPLPTIPSGNVASALGGAFEVANSCQFSSDDTTYLSKTFGTPTDQDKWTFSCWVKRTKLGTNQDIFSVPTGTSGGYFHTGLQWNSSNQLEANVNYTGSVVGKKLPNALFRDTISWYHLVTVWDSDNASAGNRIKLYVNGVDQTSFATDTQPTSGLASQINQALAHRIGDGANGDLDGYLAEVVFVDGQALTPTSFGEFDEDSPTIWKPIKISGLTFGNNGFYLDFQDSSALGNDVSGNNNDFALSNLAAVHQCQDSPTNNFCILHQLQPYGSAVYPWYDAGTQFVGTQGNAWRIVTGSIAVTSGKYYYEVEINTSSSNNSYSIGWTSTNNMPASIWTTYLGDAVVGPALGLAKDGQLNYSTSSAANQASTGYTSYSNGGDIVMCAIDLDNNYAYWGKNGTWMKSGDPTSGSTGTGGFAFDNAAGYDWYPAFGSSETASGSTIHMAANFGNGTFGNVSGVPSAVASAGTNASGFGVFEYNVPAGYGAICTKQMNE